MMAKSAVVALQQWLGETFSHAIGNPREEKVAYMKEVICGDSLGKLLC